ncbi:MAG: trypsin-like serine peptidase [Bdellovibrio sp.]|jgi:V8-like Glu-specific endopeptidase
MRLALYTAVMLMFAGISAFAAQMDLKVIYGSDDRSDVYENKNANLVALADATAAMFPLSKLRVTAQGRYSYDRETFAESYGTCQNEPYRHQPVAAVCSGFLVGEDVLATAGHCVDTANDCQRNAWVFGYRMANATQVPDAFEADQVYRCKEVLHSVQVGRGKDFALIRLDRPVRGARPVTLRSQGSLGVGEPIFVIGHPMGLPTKVAGGARVRRWDRSKTFFVANLDTYGGNSGSAVFNEKTLEVEGILVRGETDLVSSRGCSRSKTCADGSCRGEDVMSITFVQKLLSQRHESPMRFN